MTPTSRPLVVHSLICQAHVEMALTCLASLYRCSDRTVDLVLHDDGSVTPEQAAQLKAAFPTSRLLSRPEADQLAADGLRSRPRCLEFRSVTVMGLKLFDPFLMGSEPFLMLDTDVLFFNAFENLFADTTPPDHALIYMEDYVYSYSVTPMETFAHPDLRPIRRLNAGMTYVYAEQIDLDYIEHLLKRHPYLIPRGGVSEQTMWGLLGTRHGARKWNPRQVSIVGHDFHASPDQVAAHFVSPSRHRLGEFAANMREGSPGRRVSVETETATPYNPVTTLCDFMGNRIHNTVHRYSTMLRGGAK